MKDFIIKVLIVLSFIGMVVALCTITYKVGFTNAKEDSYFTCKNRGEFVYHGVNFDCNPSKFVP